jgi:glutathione S-transferase
LNVAYRRIPLLSIGKDVYCDTRLILRKLEGRYPVGKLGSSDPDQRAIERLLERYTGDAGIFTRAASLLPAAVFADPEFIKDREQFSGRKGFWDKDKMEAAKPESAVHIRDAFELLETTLLADGRDWIFKTQEPSLGDIEGEISCSQPTGQAMLTRTAIWPFHWLADLPGALPKSVISPIQYPKVFGWIERFRTALAQAKASAPKQVKVTGEEVVKYMQTAKFAESVGEVAANDPLGLKPGDEIEVFPIESGFQNRDRGTLLTLTPNEVVVGKKMNVGGSPIRVHYQRWGFRIVKIPDSKL